MKTALIPGSFDPITLGHINVIERAAKIFDKVIVAVMTNDSEKYGAAKSAKQYMFSRAERLKIAAASCKRFDNVQVIEADGLLIDLFDSVGADVIVKGVRDDKDFLYERKHSDWNIAHNPKAETFYLPAMPEFENVSSTKARTIISEGGDLSSILPAEAINIIDYKGES